MCMFHLTEQVLIRIKHHVYMCIFLSDTVNILNICQNKPKPWTWTWGCKWQSGREYIMDFTIASPYHLQLFTEEWESKVVQCIVLGSAVSDYCCIVERQQLMVTSKDFGNVPGCRARSDCARDISDQLFHAWHRGRSTCYFAFQMCCALPFATIRQMQVVSTVLY